MSRRVFKKALNRIESRSYESNISRLNDELKKTGMLSERMTTSTVLPATETQPFQEPTISFVPDANGLTDTAARESFSAQPTYGGDESDSSTWSTGWNSNAYLLNPNELDGETNRPLTYAPDKTPAGASGLVYGSFYYGTAIGYIDENNVFQSVLAGGLTGGYTGPNQTGLYYPEGSPQRENYERQVSYYNAHLELVNRFGLTNQSYIHRQYTSYVNVWVAHSIHHHGSFESWTSSPKKPGFILRQAEVPTGVSARSKYTSDPGQPRTLVLNRLDDPSSPDYYEGFMNEYFRKNLNLSGQGLDHLLLASMAGEGVLPGVDDILLLGISGLITLFGFSMQAAQSLYDYAMVMQSTNSMTVPLPGGNEKADSGYGPTVDNPTAKDLTPEQQAEVEAAGNELRDAQRALRDLEDNPDATDTQKDLAQERLDRASKNRQRLRKKHKEENKNRKESFNLNGGVLSEGWQSPDHTNVEKDSKTRWFNPNAGTDSAKWFDPKEVKPAYPAKAPPKMIDGYSATSNLAPKPIEKSPVIKLTKKDLLRNHKLKDSEILMMMQTIARLNKFIADHPEELIFAKSRYPKHDPRLAELNWNMDQMLKASGDYLDKQFPENERLFNKVKSATKRSIDLTDPETYKKDPGDLSSIGNLARVDHVMNYYEPKDRTVSKIKMENRKSVNRFFEKPKRPDRPAFLRKKK